MNTLPSFFYRSISAVYPVPGKQAGIFQVFGFTEEQMAHIGNVICPTIVYPYLRANVADMITRTTMAPVNLPEMNFEMLYQQRLAQAAAEKAAQQQN